MPFVLQDWMSTLTWKEQTVLLVALRGPDLGGTPGVKLMIRWLRSVVLNNAAPNKTFMRDTAFPQIRELAEQSPLAFDMLPVHFLSHLMHAFEVVGYRHQDRAIASKALEAYRDLCEYFHLNAETPLEMTARLADEIATARLG